VDALTPATHIRSLPHCKRKDTSFEFRISYLQLCDPVLATLFRFAKMDLLLVGE